MPPGYFNLTVGSLVTLVCPTGYSYFVGSGSLDVVCLVSTATAGVWSTAAGYCTRTRRTLLQLPADSRQPTGCSNYWVCSAYHVDQRVDDDHERRKHDHKLPVRLVVLLAGGSGGRAGGRRARAHASAHFLLPVRTPEGPHPQPILPIGSHSVCTSSGSVASIVL